MFQARLPLQPDAFWMMAVGFCQSLREEWQIQQAAQKSPDGQNDQRHRHQRRAFMRMFGRFVRGLPKNTISNWRPM